MALELLLHIGTVTLLLGLVYGLFRLRHRFFSSLLRGTGYFFVAGLALWLGSPLLFHTIEWPLVRVLVVYVIPVLFILPFLYEQIVQPGMTLFCLGWLCNLSAVIANGGLLPVSRDTLVRLGLSPFALRLYAGHSYSLDYLHAIVPDSNLHLRWLTDQFLLPSGWWYGLPFSVGGVLMLAGLLIYLGALVVGSFSDLGRAAFRRGDLVAALHYYKQAAQKDPQDGNVYYNLGVIQQKMGQTDEAIEHYWLALKLIPNHSQVHAALGRLYSLKGQYTAAVGAYRRAFRFTPNQLQIRCSLAWTLYKAEQFEEATREYLTLLQANPDDPNAHYGLGWLAFEQDDMDEALAQFQAASLTATGQELAHIYYALGAVYQYRGNFDRALLEYHKAQEEQMTPALEAAVHAQYADMQRDRGDLTGSVREYRLALALEKDNPLYHTRLGQVFAEQGDLETALHEHNAALERNPQKRIAALVHTGRGEVYRLQGRLEAATLAHEEALAFGPPKRVAATIQVHLGRLALDRGKEAEAEISFHQALALAPYTSRAIAGLADIAALRANLGEALRLYQEALRLLPCSGSYHCALAALYAKLQHVESARSEYGEALACDPQSIEARCGLAAIAEQQGNQEEALVRYREALLLQPNHPALAAPLVRLTSQLARQLVTPSPSSLTSQHQEIPADILPSDLAPEVLDDGSFSADPTAEASAPSSFAPEEKNESEISTQPLAGAAEKRTSEETDRAIDQQIPLEGEAPTPT